MMKSLATIAGGMLATVAGGLAMAAGPFGQYGSQPYQPVRTYGAQLIAATPGNCPGGVCPTPASNAAYNYRTGTGRPAFNPADPYQANYRTPVALPTNGNCPNGRCGTPNPGGNYLPPSSPGAAPSVNYPVAGPATGSSPFYSPAPQSPVGASPWDLTEDDTASFNPWRFTGQQNPRNRPRAGSGRDRMPSQPVSGAPSYRPQPLPTPTLNSTPNWTPMTPTTPVSIGSPFYP